MVDTLNAHVRSLEKLKGKMDEWGNMILTHIIQSKLDFFTKRDWERSQEERSQEGDSSTTSTYEDFIKFLMKRGKSLMREENEKGQDRVSKPNPSMKLKSEHRKLSLTTTIASCVNCKGDHKLFFCDDFLKLSPQERKSKVKSLQLCHNCLGKGHFVKQCQSSKCRKCGLAHNTLLHIEQQASSAGASIQTEPNPDQSDTPSLRTSMTSHCHKKSDSYVLLATAVVLVKNKNNQYQQCRALIDPGSQSSYVTHSMMQELKIVGQPISEKIAGINSAVIQINSKATIALKSRINDYFTKIECLVLPSITQKLPQFPIDMNLLQIPETIQLADPEYYNPAEINMLLGADVVWSLLEPQQIQLQRNQPSLRNTKLGWIISGPLTVSKRITRQTCHSISLEQQVQDLLDAEDVPTTQPKEEQELCEQHFVENVQRTSDGRFVVRLPTKPEIALGESYNIAKRKLLMLERRLIADRTLKQEYSEFMKEYTDLGHMIPVSHPDQESSSYFIPHQPVIREQALTTKLRVVFNASSTTTNGCSLNDKLMVGATIQPDIFTLLVRFRIHQFVLTADIEKMYRQIKVDKRDQPLQRILWRVDDQASIQVFQLTTVTYGMASAPFLATRCLMQLAKEDGDNYPNAKGA